jgi:hypothetical protein
VRPPPAALVVGLVFPEAEGMHCPGGTPPWDRELGRSACDRASLREDRMLARRQPPTVNGR